MRTFNLNSYDPEQLDDPTLALIDRIFSYDDTASDREKSGVRPVPPLYTSPCEEDPDSVDAWDDVA